MNRLIRRNHFVDRRCFSSLAKKDQNVGGFGLNMASATPLPSVQSRRAFSSQKSCSTYSILSDIANLTGPQLSLLDPQGKLAIARLGLLPMNDRYIIPPSIFITITRLVASELLDEQSSVQWDTSILAELVHTLRVNGYVQGDRKGSLALLTLENELGRRDLSKLPDHLLHNVLEVTASAGPGILQSLLYEIRRRALAQKPASATPPIQEQKPEGGVRLQSLSHYVLPSDSRLGEERPLVLEHEGVRQFGAGSASATATSDVGISSIGIHELISKIKLSELSSEAVISEILRRGGISEQYDMLQDRDIPQDLSLSDSNSQKIKLLSELLLSGDEDRSGGSHHRSSNSDYSGSDYSKEWAAGSAIALSVLLGIAYAGITSVPRSQNRLVAVLESAAPETLISMLRVSLLPEDSASSSLEKLLHADELNVGTPQVTTLVMASCIAILRKGLDKFTLRQLSALLEIIPVPSDPKAAITSVPSHATAVHVNASQHAMAPSQALVMHSGNHVFAASASAGTYHNLGHDSYVVPSSASHSFLPSSTSTVQHHSTSGLQNSLSKHNFSPLSISPVPRKFWRSVREEISRRLENPDETKSLVQRLQRTVGMSTKRCSLSEEINQAKNTPAIVSLAFMLSRASDLTSSDKAEFAHTIMSLLFEIPSDSLMRALRDDPFLISKVSHCISTSVIKNNSSRLSSIPHFESRLRNLVDNLSTALANSSLQLLTHKETGQSSMASSDGEVVKISGPNILSVHALWDILHMYSRCNIWPTGPDACSAKDIVESLMKRGRIGIASASTKSIVSMFCGYPGRVKGSDTLPSDSIWAYLPDVYATFLSDVLAERVRREKTGAATNEIESWDLQRVLSLVSAATRHIHATQCRDHRSSIELLLHGSERLFNESAKITRSPISWFRVCSAATSFAKHVAFNANMHLHNNEHALAESACSCEAHDTVILKRLSDVAKDSLFNIVARQGRSPFAQLDNSSLLRFWAALLDLDASFSLLPYKDPSGSVMHRTTSMRTNSLGLDATYSSSRDNYEELHRAIRGALMPLISEVQSRSLQLNAFNDKNSNITSQRAMEGKDIPLLEALMRRTSQMTIPISSCVGPQSEILSSGAFLLLLSDIKLAIGNANGRLQSTQDLHKSNQ